MEIPLFVLLSLVLVERFLARGRVWVLGLVAGLLTLARPEGAVLGALVGIGLLESPRHQTHENSMPDSPGDLAVKLLFYALGFAIFVAPYLVFNLAVSGAIFPNTFYAKNAEYAILIEQTPLAIRLAQTIAAPWVGAQILLLPGFIFIIARLVKNCDWRALVPAAWIVALPALYALRLPVTYQHARYEMPVVPFIVVYGIWGTMELLGRVRSFVARGVWVASTGAVLIAFWFIGAGQYATDVSLIDCEMVQTAHWVAANAPRNALVAAHDIGALGYFYDRPFLDLAGLVSPEVIPFIRDESRLREFLLARHAALVIVFPDWYSSLIHGLDPVFQTDCAATREQGGTNMTVYKILLSAP
jgi:hypothetical protein